MKQMLFLAAFAVFFRMIASALRASPSSAADVLGWILTGLTGWFSASALGAWSPFWTAFLPALPIALFSRRLARSWTAPLLDAMTALFVGLVSVPVLGWSALLAAAGVAVVAGGIADGARVVLARKSRWAFRAGLAAMAVAVAIVMPDGLPLQVASSWRDPPARASRLALTPLATAERIVLPTGAVAWLEHPPRASRDAVLFFHGYHKQGANQPAALVARRAILDAGFLLLSLDEPGFGDSPSPPRDGDLAAWDPFPSELAAYDALRERASGADIRVIGHSQGTLGVARMLASDRPIRGGVMLGAGFSKDKPTAGPYWHKRFNKVHQFDPPMPFERFVEIAEAHFDKRRAIQALPPTHAPLLFVVFSKENPDLAETRDALYELIPGEKSKAVCETSHYLHGERVEGLLVGDPLAARRLSRILREWTNAS